MAYLWQQLPESEGEPAWHPVPLSPGSPFPLASCILRNVSTPAVGIRPPWCLIPSRQALAGAICVNAEPIGLGIRVLADRDSITTGDGILRFFTEEEPSRIGSFPVGKSGTCARCRNAISQGELAVRCPGCGAWCHQSDDFPCWAYEGTSTCPFCDHPNALDAFRWSPADEGW